MYPFVSGWMGPRADLEGLEGRNISYPVGNGTQIPRLSTRSLITIVPIPIDFPNSISFVAWN
jgi:hypothetical protein